jgi:NSS family neurotransmitter:Na+ symporter
MNEKETWKSRLGFIFAASGSAIGLANIWRFPYIVGNQGGAAFVCVYLICLFSIGVPVFISEVLIGRTTRKSPSGAFKELTKGSVFSKFWGFGGKLTILTGFLVSSFYSVVAGWILGYCVQAFSGNIHHFASPETAMQHYNSLLADPYWTVLYHSIFILSCTILLLFGVRRGIEAGSKIMMPLLYIILIGLVVKGLLLPNSSKGLTFLLKPDWAAVTPSMIMIALGQSFFTLSLGQGTMVTYGSYLRREGGLLGTCLPVILMDTVVSLLAAVAVMTIVFSVGLEPAAGPGLLFQTLPMVFSSLPGGHYLAIFFFSLVLIAAITSEISAMEPLIAYLEERRWPRQAATLLCGFGAFLIGLPAALSFSIWKQYNLFGWSYFDFLNNLCFNVLIPLGGLLAVFVVAWVWGMKNAIKEINYGTAREGKVWGWVEAYFWLCVKFLAPVLILFVFLNALGMLPIMH